MNAPAGSAVRAQAVAPRLAVATVRLDSPLPHLDRPFDYVIPERLAETVVVGSRVRVPFAGRLVSAVVTGLSATSQFEGKLSEIRSAGATPSFTPAGIDLAERIARRYGGSVWDVLRLMAPPRVASVEKRDWTLPSPSSEPESDPYRAALAGLVTAQAPSASSAAGHTDPVSATSSPDPANATSSPDPVSSTSATDPVNATSSSDPVSAPSSSDPVSATSSPDPVSAPSSSDPVSATSSPNPANATTLTLSGPSQATDLEQRLLADAGDRVIWEALPDHEPRTTIAAQPLIEAALETAASGASAVLVVPDARAAGTLLAETKRLGLRRWTARSGGQVAVLDHDDGPAVRFGNYLAAMHGHARIVIGTRPTVMQPVPKLGLIAVWDEANGALEDPHAPYPHARTLAAMRAEDGAALILGGYALSAEAVALVEHGWARLLTASRDQVRDAVPAVDVLTAERRDAEGGSGWHWMPGSVWRSLRAAVAEGPVAIIVPRAGYVRATACARCEAWAECRECSSLLGLPSPGANPVCLDEGHEQVDWHCPECQGSTLKHVRQGAERIAEQLDRMLGDTKLTVSSAAAGIVPDHQVTEGVVLATPAALPAVDGGYRHLAVLDAGVPAGLGLGGELKAIRWWLNAAALVRSRRDGGAVTIVGEVPPAVRRALSSWSPADAALAEYHTRGDISLPPHRRYLTVHGEPDVVAHALERAELIGASPDIVTQISLAGGKGILLPRSLAQAAVDSLRTSVQAASKAGRELRLRVDGPLELPR